MSEPMYCGHCDRPIWQSISGIYACGPCWITHWSTMPAPSRSQLCINESTITYPLPKRKRRRRAA